MEVRVSRLPKPPVESVTVTLTPSEAENIREYWCTVEDWGRPGHTVAIRTLAQRVSEALSD